jgi:hypothetical protein
MTGQQELSNPIIVATMLPAIRCPMTSTLSRSLPTIHAMGPSNRSPLHVASRLVTRSLPVPETESGNKVGSQFRENDLLGTLTQPQQLRWIGIDWVHARANRRVLAPIQASTDLSFLKLHLQEYQRYHLVKRATHFAIPIWIAAVSTFAVAPGLIMSQGFDPATVFFAMLAAMAPFFPISLHHHARYREVSLMLMKVKYRLGHPNPIGPSHHHDRCIFDTNHE